MPDITNSTYNSNNELIDQVGGGLPAIGPDPSLTPNQNAAPNTFYADMQSIASKDNPWLKNNFLNEPLKVKVADGERYQDPTYGFNPYNPNIENQYGDRQGFLEKWGHNLIKFGGNVTGSFIEGLAVLPLTFNAIKSGKLSEMENSPLVNGLTDWQTKLENDYPNYETTFSKEHPFLDYVPFIGHSGDSWGGVLKNLGYTAGAIGSALVQDTAIGALTEGLGAVPLISTQLTKVLGGLGKIFGGSEDVYKGYVEAKKAGMPIVNAIERAATTAKIVDKIKYNLALLTSSTSEALVEGNQSMNDVKTALTKEFYDKHGYEASGADLEEIKNSSLSSGNATLLANIALLTFTNSIQFGSLLKPMNAAKGAIEASIDDGLNIKLKTGSIDVFEAVPALKSGLKGILKKQLSSEGFESFVTEGFEEGSQYVVQQTADKYYERKYDQKSIDQVDNFTKSLSEGLHDVFTTREGLENILVGGLSGAIIHPMRSLAQKALGIKSNTEARLTQTLDLLNKNPVTGLFSDKFNAAVNSYNLATNASAKLQNGDLYGYRNEKFLQLFNFVDAGLKTHRFDAQIDRLNMIKDLPFKEQASLLGINDTNTTKQMLDSHVDATIAKAIQIKSDIEKVDGAFKNKINSRTNPDTYNLFESYKSEIAASISQLRDNKQRIQSVGDEVRKLTPFADINKIVNLTTDAGLKQTIKDLQGRISELNTDDKLFTDTKKKGEIQKERSFLEGHIEDINSLLNRPSNFQNQEDENKNITNQDIKDKQLPIVHSLVNYYANGMDDTKEEVDQIDAVDIFNKSQDIAKLYGDVSNLKKYYSTLIDNKGFKDFAKAENMLIAKRQAENPIGKPVNTENTPSPENVNPDDIAVPEDIDETIDTTGTKQTANEEKVKPEPIQPVAETADQPFDPDAVDAEIARKAQEEKDKAKGKNGRTDEEVKAALKREAARAAAGDDLLNAEEDLKEAQRERQRELAKDGITAEQKAQLEKEFNDKIADLEAKIKDLTTVKEKLDKEATPKDVKATQGNRKYDFNPITYFYKVFTGDWKDSGAERLNMTDAILNKTKQFIYNALGLKITDSTKGLEFGKYKLLVKDKENKIFYKNLYQTGYAQDMTLTVDGKSVGLIQPSNRFAFKRGEEYLPLTELTKEEYNKVTENSPDTYDDFMKDLKSYDEVVNKIINDYKQGKTEFANDEIKKLFNIGVSYGKIRYSNAADTSTDLKNITYDKPGNVVLSMPMIYDAGNKVVSRSNNPEIIGKEKLDPETSTKLLTFIANNIDRLKNLNSRYIFIAQLPNGEYDLTSPIVARPTILDDTSTKEMFNLLSKVPKPEDVEHVNAQLADMFYIADAGNKGSGTNISFSFNKDGKLYININNKRVTYIKNGEIKTGYNKRIPVNEPNRSSSLAELLNRINSNIQFQKKTDKGLEILNINLTKNNVKNGILSDENVTFASLKDKLSLAIQPGKDGIHSNIFEDPSLSVIPLNRRTSAPKTETKTQQTQKTETKEVMTNPEVKVSTEIAKNFVQDKEAKEKARNEAKTQTTQEVEDDFLKSLGCK